MAESTNNIVMKGISGTIDKTLTFRQRAGRTIVAKQRRQTPASTSEKATAVRARFKSSSVYAKAAIKDPAVKAFYLAAAKGIQTAYNMAMADAFIPPMVLGVNSAAYHGAVGNTLIVQATDNFKVAGVQVSIHNAAGDLLEQGNAVAQGNDLDWLYTATVANAVLAGSKITALATDLPGNSTSFSTTL